MRLKTKSVDRASVAAIIAAAAVTSACGSARSETGPDGAAPSGVPASSDGNGANISGGMDSGGNTVASKGNTSPDGVVTTSIGALVNVRSVTPLTHIFQPAEAGVPERLFLRHYLETPTGDVVIFEFDYVDGSRSFAISENGFLAFTQSGTELVAKAGNVTIEPVENGALKVSFDGIAVGVPDANDAPPTALEAIGSGWVVGPMRRACLDGGEQPEVQGGEANLAPAASAHDAAWIAAFCGN